MGSYGSIGLEFGCFVCVLSLLFLAMTLGFLCVRFCRYRPFCVLGYLPIIFWAEERRSLCYCQLLLDLVPLCLFG
jgi:hypothetical protein